jgi:hypothetical protein
MLIAMFQRPINWIREDLNERLADGELLIGSADCEGFSPITGCPGHPSTFLEKYGNVEVRALSWKQPFASLMLNGKIETRVWPTKYRGWVLICASQLAYTGKELSKISGTKQMLRISNALVDHHSPAGQAIAIGKLSEIRFMTKEDEDVTFVKYQESTDKPLICHIYTDVQTIVPFEWKGVQNWKVLTDEVKAQIKFL